MSSSLLRRAPFHYNCLTTSSTPISLRSFSNVASDQDNSFTVSYLQNSVGLSPKAASSASKRVSFKTCERPDLVVKLLQGYGFTGTHIAALVRARPRVLLSDCGKTISPKLEFLKSKGVSCHNVSMLTSFLHSSLENQIIPAFEFFRSVIPSEKKLISALSRCPDLLAQNVSKLVVPNITVLRENGVSDSNVAALIRSKPNSILVTPDKFRQTVERVAELGLNASTYTFIEAISVFRSMTKSTWESKVDALKEWGWSEEEILTAFKNHPRCMTKSLEKIAATMDFFFRETGLSPSNIASCPKVMCYSLEKRVKPRYLVIRVLLSEGLLKKEYGLALVYGLPDEKFLERFVTPFQAEAPELMKLYEDSKLGLSSASERH